MLVDEYQDTNRAQYEIIRHLVGEGGNVTVVGDEDQSIYSWRGADIQNILDFEHDFPGARVFRLEQNYRSSQAILDTASALVAHNQRRKGKTLRAVRAAGAPVRLHTATDEYEEAAWVVDRIASERGGRGRAAILFRMNAQSRLFEEALLRRRLPYVVVGGVGFYERREVKDLLSYLRLVLNPEDPVALRRVLNVPPRGIGAKSAEELERVAESAGGEPLGGPRQRSWTRPSCPPGPPSPSRVPRAHRAPPRGGAPADRQGAHHPGARGLGLLGRSRPGGLPGEPGPTGEPGRADLGRGRLRRARARGRPAGLPGPDAPSSPRSTSSGTMRRWCS